MAKKFTATENAGLRELFGKGPKGADDTLQRDRIEIPPGVTAKTLVRYREVAQDAIAKGRDALGVQEKRLRIIDKLLPAPLKQGTV